MGSLEASLRGSEDVCGGEWLVFVPWLLVYVGPGRGQRKILCRPEIKQPFNLFALEQNRRLNSSQRKVQWRKTTTFVEDSRKRLEIPEIKFPRHRESVKKVGGSSVLGWL